MSASPEKSYVFSRAKSFANIPPPPGGQDRLLGGQPQNAYLHVNFIDKSRKATKLVVLYTFGGKAKEADVTTALYSGEKSLKPQYNQLKEGWNEITFPLAVDRFDMSVNDPDTGSNLLLAQVTYSDD